VSLLAYPVDFSVYDINHSGSIDLLDAELVAVSLDFDHDDDVDLHDFAALQVCATGAGRPPDPPICGLADLDLDGDADAEDLVRFILGWTGPAGCETEDCAVSAWNPGPWNGGQE